MKCLNLQMVLWLICCLQFLPSSVEIGIAVHVYRNGQSRICPYVCLCVAKIESIKGAWARVLCYFCSFSNTWLPPTDFLQKPIHSIGKALMRIPHNATSVIVFWCLFSVYVKFSVHTAPLLKKKKQQALAGHVFWYAFEWVHMVGMFDKALAKEVAHWF